MINRKIIIFGGAVVLFILMTTFLYYSVFSTPHKYETYQLEKRNQTKHNSSEKDLFIINLPKDVNLVPVKPVGQITFNTMQNMQNSQCSATRGNLNPPRSFITKPENSPWPNFSPSTFSIETDFIQWKNNNSDYWNRISRGLDGEALNSEKLKMNEMGLTLNLHLKPKEGHLPIWLKTFKRRNPLDIVLDAVCRIDDISHTILYVTIDGGDFDQVVEELIKVKCVKVKIYFHPILSDLRNLGLDKRNLDTGLVLNSHYVYGLYLLTHKLDYPYVITLEDDLEPTPDFYRFHYSLYHFVFGKQASYYNSKKIFAIGAFSHGPIVDCISLAAKLSNDETHKCGNKAVHQLVEEDYFPGWGSGIPKESFLEYWGDWKSNRHIYDYGMSMLRSGENRYTLVPCSHRVRTIANAGINGQNSGRWDHYISQFAQWNEKPLNRIYYVDRRDGVVKADDKGKFLYNKLT